MKSWVSLVAVPACLGTGPSPQREVTITKPLRPDAFMNEWMSRAVTAALLALG